MANVAHSTLTGSNLHENKGVAAATDNYVATATSGATVWKKLDNTNLAALGNPFGANLLHVRHEEASGTNAGLPTANTWTTRELNTTKTNEISGASLATNQITLPAGTYWFDGRMSFYAVNGAKSRLYNVTDASTTLNGSNVYTSNSNSVSSDSFCKGRFTIAGTKTFAFQYYENASPAGDACLGVSFAGSGTTEVYADVMIWRIA